MHWLLDLSVVCNDAAVSSIDRLSKAEQLEDQQSDFISITPRECQLLGSCLRMTHAHRQVNFSTGGVDIRFGDLIDFYDHNGYDNPDRSRIARLLSIRGYEITIWDDPNHAIFTVRWKTGVPSTEGIDSRSHTVAPIGPLEPAVFDHRDDMLEFDESPLEELTDPVVQF